MAPISVYLLFDAHPASRMPNTPTELTASTKKMPMFQSMICRPLPHGRHASIITDDVMTR